MPLMNGETFAGYTIIRLLGSGGMGEVYLAQHPRLPRRDALKVLPAEVSADPDYRARFHREADLASKLWHPHIVSVHDRGEAEGQLWISMDYVDGLDAGRLLASRYPDGMPRDQVVRIITSVASALDYAHKQGLLHRDVKPANIMLAHVDENDDEQRVLLSDFGIAHSVDDISGLTATNMTVGTVAYAAPEQLMGEQLDGRADEYALAATAYHLLTGSHVFPHSNPAVVISRHLNAPPPTLVDSRPQLAQLDPILAVGLAKRPDDRFERCSDFARAMSQRIIPAGAPTQEAPLRPPPGPRAAPGMDAVRSRGQPVEKKARTSRLIAASATVIAVILVAGLMLTWRPWELKSASNSGGTPGPSTSFPAHVAPPVITTAVTPAPPPPPSFSPKTIDQVLLSAAQLSKVLGVHVSSDPAGGGGGGLALNNSSYGTADHSGQVTPRSCVGVVFTGEHDVYAGTDPSAIKTQTFGNLYGGSSNSTGPYLLQQTAAVYPSAEQAQAFLKSSQAQWDACSRGTVDATLGYENGRGYTLGTVQRHGDLITLSMASPGGENSPDACQQALGVKQNVVVETRTCAVPNTSAAPPYSDPGWAVPDAERVVKAMLENVT